jgi:hypothetical protein
MRAQPFVGLALAALLVLSGCAGTDPALAGDIATRKVRVVATTGMVADVVQRVGGDRVTVRALMGPGVDPHLYRAKASDVEAMQRADIIFYSGLHLEGKLVELFEKMALRRPTVAVTRAIPPERLRKPIEFEGNYDPHVWFDVALWRYTVDVVAEELSVLDPGSASTYRANAERYRAELDRLDTFVREQIATIPPERRVLITAHDALATSASPTTPGARPGARAPPVRLAPPRCANWPASSSSAASRHLVESSVPRRTIGPRPPSPRAATRPSAAAPPRWAMVRRRHVYRHGGTQRRQSLRL